MTKLVCVVSDLHVNSALGLLPPDAQRGDGQAVGQSVAQRWLWQHWLEFWSDAALAAAQLHAEPLAILNGDWGDLNRHSNAQLLTADDPDTVLTWMQAAVKPATLLCEKQIYVVRGTEAHTGGAGWLENRAAQAIDARPDSETGAASFWTLRLQVEGVHIFAAHHPGTNSTVPWTIGAAANRAAVKTELAFYNEAERPDLALFGHVHHFEDSGDNHPIRAIYTPPWCLADTFTFRLGHGWGAQEVGGLLIVVKGKRYRVIKRAWTLPVGGVKWLQA